MSDNPTIDECQPQFEKGCIIRHKRYGYRGVIVDSDPRCLATKEWYLSNKTQPDCDQPWYHVLVDSSSATTYAAQENLDEDNSNRPICHPLVDEFFNGFFDGRHIRNGNPWPC